MSRIYSPFDQPSLGADLAVDDTGYILTVSATCDGHRMARSTIAVEDQSAVEFQLYSPDGTAPSLAPSGGVPTECCGIVTAAAGNDKFVGEDAYGVGYCFGDGKVRINNVVVATFATSTYKDFVEVIPDPAAAAVLFKKNGTPLGDPIAITAGQAWYYAASLSGDPNQRGWYVNPGDTPMRHPQGDLGYWEPGDTIEQVLLATEPRITPPDDLIPHLKFAGDLDRQQNPVAISDSIRAWPWGPSAPSELGSGGLAQLQVNDPLLKHERLLSGAARDKVVPIARGGARDASTAHELVFVGVLDHGEPDSVYGNQVKRVYLRNKLSAQLGVALRRARFSPAADPSVAGKPRPMRLGVVHNDTPELEDADANLFAWTDQDAITAFGTARESGVPITYGVDFHISSDGAGIVADTDNGGLRTYSATSYGGSFDAGAPDYWAGAGDFPSLTDADADLIPDGWTRDSAVGALDSYGHPAGWRLNAGVGLEITCHGFENHTITPPAGTPQILAGRTYSVRVSIARIPQFGEHLGGGPAYTPPATLYLTYADSSVPNNAQFSRFATIALDHTGDVDVTFTSPLSTDKPLSLSIACNGVEAGDNAYTLNFLRLTGVSVVAFPPASSEAELAGPGLDYCLQALIIQRGPVSATDYVAADAQAIDTATGYEYGIPVSSNEDPSIIELIDGDTSAPRLLHPTCSMLKNDESGRYRVVRLIKPETVADVDLKFDLVGGVDNWGKIRRYPDLAENLTTRICGRRNLKQLGASDFGDAPLSGTGAVSRAEREYLAQAYLWTVATRKQLHPRYLKAYTRKPLLSFLDDSADGQDAIDYACDFYVDPRGFWGWDIFEPLGKLLVKGDVGRITDRTESFLAGGLKVMFVGYAQRLPSEQKVTAYFWGLDQET